MLFGIQYKSGDDKVFEVEFTVDAETEEQGWMAANEEATRLTNETGMHHWVDGMIVWQEDVPDDQFNLLVNMLVGIENGTPTVH